MKVAELWRRGQAGWPRRFPLVQLPNPPLLLALAARAASGVGEVDGALAAAGRSLFVLGLGVWAWEELAAGANWFRRLLGLAGVTWVVRLALWATAPAAAGVDHGTVLGPEAGPEMSDPRGTLP